MTARWRCVVAVLSTAGGNRKDADKTTAPFDEAQVRWAMEAFGFQIEDELRRKSYAADWLPDVVVIDGFDQLFRMYLGDPSSSPCLSEEGAAEALVCLTLGIRLVQILKDLFFLSAISGEVESIGTSDTQAYDVMALAALQIGAVLYLMAIWTLAGNVGLVSASPKEIALTVLDSKQSCSLRMKLKSAAPRICKICESGSAGAFTDGRPPQGFVGGLVTSAPIRPVFDHQVRFSCPARMRDLGHLRIAVPNEDAAVRSGTKISVANAKPRYQAHWVVCDPASAGGERSSLSEAGPAVTVPNPGASAPSTGLATYPSALAGANFSRFQRLAVLGAFACHVLGGTQTLMLAHTSADAQLLED